MLPVASIGTRSSKGGGNRRPLAARRGKPAVICLGAGTGQLPLIEKAREMGFAVIAVDRNPEAPGFRRADKAIVASTGEAAAVVRRITGLRGLYSPRGVVARTSLPAALETALRLSRNFGLPGTSGELIAIATSKSALRTFCRARRLSVPQGVRALSPADVPADLPFPAILKPDATLRGKQAIRLCEGHGAVRKYFGRASAASANGAVEVQSFIPGIDVTCAVHMKNGRARLIAWWDELVGIDSDNRIRGMGVSMPSVIEGTPAERKARRIVRRLASGLPEVDAVVLVSLRVDMKGGVSIIELHADLGGDLIAEHLLPAAVPSLDYFGLSVSVALGRGAKGLKAEVLPSLLLYGVKDAMRSPGSVRAGRGFAVLQAGSVGRNLALLPRVARRRGLALRVRPRHLEWLGRAEGPS